MKSIGSVKSHPKLVRAFFGALRLVDFTGDAADREYKVRNATPFDFAFIEIESKRA